MKTEGSNKPQVQEHREEQSREPSFPSEERSAALFFTGERKSNDDHQEQQIRELAYKLYEEGGRIDGHDVEHWLEAESIIRRMKKSAA